jgi:hypothetical protein
MAPNAMNPLLTLAAAVALLAPQSPFPAPKLVGVTPETKCDWGPITEITADHSQLTMKTDAGPFELKIGAGVKVASADGRALTSALELRSGQNVRVYYVVDRGARAMEIDVIP